MGLIFLITMGSVLGWLATIIRRAADSHALSVNVAAGIGGAFVAALIINPLLGKGQLLEGAYTAGALLICLAGSVVVLISVNLLHRSEIR